MAHLIMSFEFDDGQVLAGRSRSGARRAASIRRSPTLFARTRWCRSRRPSGTSVRLRSNVRGEDVSSPAAASPAAIRTLLVGYVDEADALAREPRWYNSLTTNCTTAVTRLIRSLGGVLPFDWRLIVNGYLPSYLYDHGAVTTPFRSPS